MTQEQIRYFTPEEFPENAALRYSVSGNAVEKALHSAVSPCWTGVTISGEMPPAGEYGVLQLTGCRRESSASPGWLVCSAGMTVRMKNRKKLLEKTTSFAAMFPFSPGTQDNIVFGDMIMTGDAAISQTELAGRKYYSAVFKLEIQVDLTSSTFPVCELPERAAAAVLTPANAESAAVQLLRELYGLDVRRGTSSGTEPGMTLQLESLSLPGNGFQNAELTLTALLTADDRRFGLLAAMLNQPPAENVNAKLSPEHTAVCAFFAAHPPVNFSSAAWPSGLRKCTLPLLLTIDLCRSSLPPDESAAEPEILSLPDPAALEMHLTEFIAGHLSLTPGRDIFRHVIPHGKNGYAVQFSRYDIQKTSSCAGFVCHIFCRDSSRDKVMESIRLCASLFPVYGRFGTAEIRCAGAETDTFSEQGSIRFQSKIVLDCRFSYQCF